MSCKKKIVYILHGLDVGGVEIALLSAIPILQKQFNIKIFVLGSINESLVRSYNVDVEKLLVQVDLPVYTFLFEINKIVKQIESFNPDIVISSLWRAHLIGKIYKDKHINVKYLSFIHSSKFFHFLDAYFTKKSLPNADKILTDSNKSAQFITKFTNKQPVIISFLTNKSTNKYKLRTIVKGQPIHLLFLGRIHAQKNLPRVIRIIHALVQKDEDVYLDIYGRDNGDKATCEKIIQELSLSKRVRFKGQITNARDKFGLFNQYHFLIQASIAEGMAMSVAEAMQSGLPCIVTPVGEIKNYAVDLHSAIFLAEEEDRFSDEIDLKKIRRVISDNKLYNSISENAYTTFKDKKTYSESLVDILNSC